MKNTFHNLLKYVNPIDVVTIGYVVFSGLYMALGACHLKNMASHLFFRLVILIIIAMISYTYYRFPNKIMLAIKNLYPLVFLSFFYTETSYMKNIIFSENLDVYFARFESYLWNGQPSLQFYQLMPQDWFNEWMNICYFSYYLLTTVICITLYIYEGPKSYKGIFTVVFSFYLYYIIYDLIPVEGPQFYFDTMNTNFEPPYFFGKIMQYILFNLEEPTGAFPSSHVGVALILSYVSFKHLKKIFYVSLPFVIGICFATVYLKAHYLTDVVGAIVTVPIFIVICNVTYRKLSELLNRVNKSSKIFI